MLEKLIGKLGNRPYSVADDKYENASEEHLRSLVVSNHLQLLNSGEDSMAVCHIEPYEDSYFKEAQLGLYVRKSHRGGHIIAKLPTEKEMKTFENPDKKTGVLAAPVACTYVRGFKLICDEWELKKLVSEMSKDELMIICVMNDIWNSPDGPKEKFLENVNRLEEATPRVMEELPKEKLELGSLVPITRKDAEPQLGCLLNYTDDGGANYVFLNDLKTSETRGKLKYFPKQALASIKPAPENVMYEYIMDYNANMVEMLKDLVVAAKSGEFQTLYEMRNMK